MCHKPIYLVLWAGVVLFIAYRIEKSNCATIAESYDQQLANFSTLLDTNEQPDGARLDELDEIPQCIAGTLECFLDDDEDDDPQCCAPFICIEVREKFEDRDEPDGDPRSFCQLNPENMNNVCDVSPGLCKFIEGPDGRVMQVITRRKQPDIDIIDPFTDF